MTTANLTIADNETVIQYTSVGESDFIFPFPILASDELKVSVDQVDQILGADYTLSGVGDSGGGTVTFGSPTTSGHLITIWQEMPIKRLTGFDTGAAVLMGEALNTEFARQVRYDQQLRRDTGRTLRLAIDDAVSGTQMELPSVAQRLGKYLRFSAISGIPEMADIVSSLVVLSRSIIGGFLYPVVAAEGATVVDIGYKYGHVFRYGAVADSALGVPGTDNTLAFQNAVGSGFDVYVPPGYYAIEGTVFIISEGSVQGGKTFKMSSNTRLERFGASVEPILHTVGQQNNVDGGGGILAVRSHGGFVKGLLLWGTDPAETDFTSSTSLVSQMSGPKNFRIIGKTSNTGWDGSVGFFVESSGRFRGDFTSPVHFNPYYSTVENIYCLQWDFPLHVSTDSNAILFQGCLAFDWGHAGFSINGYGNQFLGCKIEAPTAQDATERFSWYFGKKNDPFGPETGCDKDAPTLDIIAITNGNPTIIQTSAAHGQTTADLIKLESIIDNGPDGDLEAALNEGHFQLTSTGADTFTIPLDTSGLTNVWSSAGVVRTDFYPILGARANQIYSFTESTFDAGNRKVRLMGFGTPVGVYDVANFKGTWSRNRLDISGNIAGGMGKDGFSTPASLGNNDVNTTVVHAERTAIVDFHGSRYERLDDDSGSIRVEASTAYMWRRDAALAESTAVPIASIDNIGPTSGGVKITCEFASKADAEGSSTETEITWAANIKTGSSFTSKKMKEFTITLPTGEAVLIVASIATAAGTNANTMKVTVTLTTQNPTGGNTLFVDWDLKIKHTSLNDGTLLDWRRDLKYL